MKSKMMVLAIAMLLTSEAFRGLAVGGELLIDYPHRIFRKNLALQLTQIHTGKFALVWPVLGTGDPLDGLGVSYPIPSSWQGTMLVEIDEGSLGGCGWNKLVQIPHPTAKIRIATPLHFAGIRFTWSPIVKLHRRFDARLDYCLRLYAVRPEVGIDPYFMASTPMDISRNLAILDLTFAEAGRYLAQIEATDSSVVLYRKAVTLDVSQLLPFKDEMTKIAVNENQRIRVDFQTDDLWDSFVRPGPIRRGSAP